MRPLTFVGMIGFAVGAAALAAVAAVSATRGPHHLALGDWPMKTFNFCEGKADGNYCGDGRIDPRLSLTCTNGKPTAARPCAGGCDPDRGICKTVSSSLATEFGLRLAAQSLRLFHSIDAIYPQKARPRA